jgi:antirestriction protein ArdC
LGAGAAYWTGVETNDPTGRPGRLARIHEQLAQAVSELTSSQGWTGMLAVAARFHQYSPANILLINAQRPDATHVAGIRTWNALGRRVRRGEHGIAILAPCLYPGGPADTTRDDPALAAADRNSTRQVLRGFRVVHVFDIAQTDGPPLPEVAPRLLEGDGPHHVWDRLAGLVTGHGYQVQRGDCGTANGRTHFSERWVRVREDVSPAQAVKTLAHELAHIRADHDTRFRDTYHASPACRGLAEVEAESIAFVVLTSLGMDTSDYTIPYVAAWANGDIELVKATAAQCVQTAHRILSDLDHTPTKTVPPAAELTNTCSAPAPRPTPAAPDGEPARISTAARQR